MTRLPSQDLRQGREYALETYALETLVAIQQAIFAHPRLEDCWSGVLAPLGLAIGAERILYFQSKSIPLQGSYLYPQAGWCRPALTILLDSPESSVSDSWHISRSALRRLQQGQTLRGPLAEFSQVRAGEAGETGGDNPWVLVSPIVVQGQCWGVLRCDNVDRQRGESGGWELVQAVVATLALKLSQSSRETALPLFPPRPLPVVLVPCDRLTSSSLVAAISDATCFQALWGQTAMGLSQLDPTYHFIRVNQRFCEIIGYSEAELLGCSIADITHPEDLNAHLELAEKLFREEIPAYTLEKRLICKDGEVRWVQLSVALVRSPAGIPQCDIAIAKDITDRKQTEARLQAQTRREQAVNRVTQTIRRSLLLDTVFSAAMQEISALLDVDFADIAQYIPAEKLWRQVACYSSHPEAFPSTLGHTFPDVDNPVTAQLKQLQRVTLTDNSYLNLVHPVLGKTLIGARILVPIPNYQSSDPNAPKVWGRLRLGKHTQPTWTEAEIEIIEILVDQLAIAIQQSELYRLVHRFNQDLEMQVQARTGELQRVLDFEALLKRITEKVRDSLDEGQILQTVVQALGQGLGVKCCDTALYDADMTTATIAYEYTPIIPAATQPMIPMAAYADLYQQIRQGKSFQFCWWGPCRVRPAKQGQVVLVCPIVDDQAVLGDLWLVRGSQESFDSLEISLVEQVAAQCAIALRQARLYAAAQVQVRELERLNHLKDDFLSTVSHELRSPMSNIKMATQMLEILLKRQGLLQPPPVNLTGNLTATDTPTTAPQNRSQLDRYFKILQDECEREISLINDLLDLSRLEAGTEPLSLSTMDLYHWLPHLVEPFHSRAANHQQHLHIMVPAGLPPLTTDFSYLGRVVRELMNNACKYTPAHETICLEAHATQEAIMLSVSNSGVEIPAVELERMFEKFYRIPSNDPWKHGGTGLGLALVKRMVDHLGATITLTHRDRTLQFTVVLPHRDGNSHNGNSHN